MEVTAADGKLDHCGELMASAMDEFARIKTHWRTPVGFRSEKDGTLCSEPGR
jgi:hypothetical protein